jgi:hypothetical protein
MPHDDELMNVEEVARALERSTATVWVLARTHNLPRYRLPARGKTTFFRWGDVRRAIKTPMPIEQRKGDDE